jgi:hypothetical protein
MITYRIIFKKANYEEIKTLAKVFKAKARNTLQDWQEKNCALSLTASRNEWDLLRTLTNPYQPRTKETTNYSRITQLFI